MLRRLFSRQGWGITGCALLGSLWLAGCKTTEEPLFTEVPGDPTTESATGTATGAKVGASSPSVAEVDRFVINDLVTVTFSGLNPPPPEHNERIKEDGTITLPYIGAVQAAGKSTGELQKEIHDLYVPKYYVRLTVTVKSLERSYTVGGEVRAPGPKGYLPLTTVTKAIQAAGGFTDFAQKKKVKLTRAGKTIIVNCKEAEEDPRKDPAVIPGDKIYVPRRLF